MGFQTGTSVLLDHDAPPQEDKTALAEILDSRLSRCQYFESGNSHHQGIHWVNAPCWTEIMNGICDFKQQYDDLGLNFVLVLVWDFAGAHSLEKQDSSCERMQGLHILSVVLDGGVTDYVQPLDHIFFRRLKNEIQKRAVGCRFTVCSPAFWKIIDELQQDETLNSLKSFRHVGLTPFCAQLRQSGNYDQLYRRRSGPVVCHLLWNKILDLVDEVRELRSHVQEEEEC